MLTKRTNILFDEPLWKNLTRMAKREGRSVGELVRSAVVKTYFADSKRREDIRQAIEQIKSNRVRGKHIDYEEMINYGRER